MTVQFPKPTNSSCDFWLWTLLTPTPSQNSYSLQFLQYLVPSLLFLLIPRICLLRISFSFWCVPQSSTIGFLLFPLSTSSFISHYLHTSDFYGDVFLLASPMNSFLSLYPIAYWPSPPRCITSTSSSTCSKLNPSFPILEIHLLLLSVSFQ